MEEEIQSATQTANSASEPGNFLEQAADSFMGLLQDSANQTEQYAEQLHYAEILLALVIATILSALIAYHPRRSVEAAGPVSDRELKKTQILIGVAGAIMVVLVQDSLERAFGLVGMGAFVRYRTTLRNPVDLSIVFILIGVGMACGLQLYQFAITVTGFMYVLIYVLEANLVKSQAVWNLKVDTNDPVCFEKVFRETAKEKQFEIIRLRSSRQAGAFRCRFLTKGTLDTDQLTKQIQARCGEGLHYSRFEWTLERE